MSTVGNGGDPGRGVNFYSSSIGASRIHPIDVNPDGTPVGRWVCRRCGQDVDNRSGNLVHLAPCRDCREFLRGEGVDTIWDKRRLAELEAAARIAEAVAS